MFMRQLFNFNDHSFLEFFGDFIKCIKKSKFVCLVGCKGSKSRKSLKRSGLRISWSLWNGGGTRRESGGMVWDFGGKAWEFRGTRRDFWGTQQEFGGTRWEIRGKPWEFRRTRRDNRESLWDSREHSGNLRERSGKAGEWSGNRRERAGNDGFQTGGSGKKFAAVTGGFEQHGRAYPRCYIQTVQAGRKTGLISFNGLESWDISLSQLLR